MRLILKIALWNLSLLAISCEVRNEPSLKNLCQRPCVIGESGKVYIDGIENWSIDTEYFGDANHVGTIECLAAKNFSIEKIRISCVTNKL